MKSSNMHTHVTNFLTLYFYMYGLQYKYNKKNKQEENRIKKMLSYLPLAVDKYSKL